MTALSIRQVRKTFGKVEILKGIDIDIAANKVADFVLDFHVCESIVKRGNSGQYNLKPVITVLPRLSDAGMRIAVGRSTLWAVPAHFLHAEGNFQFWDPVSRILFSGDLGVSLGTSADAARPITSLAAHVQRMEGFHRRYMVSGKILKYWAQMVKAADIKADQ